MIQPKEPKTYENRDTMVKVIVFILKEIIFIFYNHWALTQGNESANMATALKSHDQWMSTSQNIELLLPAN